MKHEFPQLAGCDAVVMLTWSDWHRELRSNRYHYATRFARSLPLVFVQADQPLAGWRYESSGHPGLDILHLGWNYGAEQTRDLARALKARGILRPLLWIYNFLFLDVVRHLHAPLRVYHATEDYLSPDFRSVDRRESLRELLRSVDLVVAVSEGVAASCRQRGDYQGEMLVLPNGCDAAFWQAETPESRSADDEGPAGPVAFYQGNINHRLDFPLLEALADRLPAWSFWFCGPVVDSADEWARLCQRSNVCHFGLCTPEELRRLAHRADVGLIPFRENELIRERSLPLKAWEYAACGLPVVSVPIRALDNEPAIFRFASGSEAFARQLEDLHREASPELRESCSRRAAKEDYELRFRQLNEYLQHRTAPIHPPAGEKGPHSGPGSSLAVCLLYDPHSVHVATLREHLESFRRHSRHRIHYLPATRGAGCRFDLDLFDVLVIHHSVRLSLPDHLSPALAEAIRACGCYRILFIQDEYDTTETSRQWIENLGIHSVYTCVPPREREKVYPSVRFPGVEFITTLSGYVPEDLARRRKWRPTEERCWLIGYRGRRLPEWYGELGREKWMIGVRMKEICRQRGIPADIEWEDGQRIYGRAWYEFLESCQATLGTESGANLFDDWGHVRSAVEELHERPHPPSWEEIQSRCLAGRDGRVRMNQVSPKIFEAIALKTALILYEGEYSGVVRPHLDYIPLRKDFSNIDEVLARLQDRSGLAAMTERAWQRVVGSGEFSYRNFVAGFDRLLDERVGRPRPTTAYLLLAGGSRCGGTAEALDLELLPGAALPCPWGNEAAPPPSGEIAPPSLPLPPPPPRLSLRTRLRRWAMRYPRLFPWIQAIVHAPRRLKIQRKQGSSTASSETSPETSPE